MGTRGNQRLQTFRAQPDHNSRNLRVNTEHMTLSELSAPPLRGIDSQVIVERTNGGETQPFIRSANGNGTEEKLNETINEEL